MKISKNDQKKSVSLCTLGYGLKYYICSNSLQNISCISVYMRDNIEEIWKPVVGYEGLYEVSNLGNVKSLIGRYKTKDIMKQTLNGKYYHVGLLNKEHKQYPELVHILVAKAFPEICGKWFEGCQIHHKDFNSMNNSAYNLQICSREEHNKIHKESEITHIKRVENQLNRKDASKPVIQYTLDMEYVNEYPSTMEAQRQTGFNRAHIGNCARGLFKSSRGFIWRYK